MSYLALYAGVKFSWIMLGIKLQLFILDLGSPFGEI